MSNEHENPTPHRAGHDDPDRRRASRERGLILGCRWEKSPRSMGFVRPPVEPPEAAADAFYRYAGEGHVMSVGPTGSGKTTGPAISNALTHPGQLISLECKGDAYAAAGEQRRRMGQSVVLLDLRNDNPDSGSFNPIDALKRSARGSGMLGRTVAAAIVPRGTREEEFWTNWAETMIASATAMTVETCEPAQHNFSALFDLFNNDDVVYGLATKLDAQSGKLSRVAHSGIAGFLQLSEKETRPSVLGSTQQHLRLWESDLIRKLTATTSFDLQGLIDGEPMSIFIIVAPAQLAAYAPVLRLWLTALMSALMTRTAPPKERTLMLCDEIGALGAFDAFVTASTLLRSSGLQLWSFWQNLAQLQLYGHNARTLMDNVGVLQVLGVANRLAAAEIAAIFGTVDADELLAMGEDECLVLIGGRRIERLKRVRYFEHRSLRELARPQPSQLPLSIGALQK